MKLSIFNGETLPCNRNNWTAIGPCYPTENDINICVHHPCTQLGHAGPGLLSGTYATYYLDGLGFQGYPAVTVDLSMRAAFGGWVNITRYGDPSTDYPGTLSLRTAIGDLVSDQALTIVSLFSGNKSARPNHPGLPLVSFLKNVTIPLNRSLQLQLLFDVYRYHDGSISQIGPPFLIVDDLRLSVEGQNSSSTTADPTPTPGLGTAAVVGASVGACAAAAVLAVLLYLAFTRWRRRHTSVASIHEATPNLLFGVGSDGISAQGLPLASSLPPAVMPPPINPAALTPEQPPTYFEIQPNHVAPISHSSFTEFPDQTAGLSSPPPSGIDTLGQYAAANRKYISPELERKLRAASYSPLDNPDVISAAVWQERYGVGQFELKRLREVYQLHQARSVVRLSYV